MDLTPLFQVDLETVMALKAAPGKIFPLLCPVLEERWIPGWRAKILHSKSGRAELGCIFRTRDGDDTERLWVVTRYEPGAGRIEFTQFQAGRCVVRLEIQLIPNGQVTRAIWRYIVRALECGDTTWAEAYAEEAFQARMARLETLLNQHLEAC